MTAQSIVSVPLPTEDQLAEWIEFALKHGSSYAETAAYIRIEATERHKEVLAVLRPQPPAQEPTP